jgi:replicative DNA helicase
MTTESEYYVLGAALRDPSALAEIDLLPLEFSTQQNAMIYAEMLSIARSGLIPDLTTVALNLQKQTADNWFPLVAQIQNNSYSQKNIRQHANKIRFDYRKRQAISIYYEAIEKLKSEDSLDSIDQAVADLMAVNQLSENYEHTFKKCVEGARDIIERNFKNKGLSGITSGLKDIDERIGGFQNTDLYVIAARPAMGKTALALNCMLCGNVPTAFISSEQGHDQIGLRAISINNSVNAQRLRIPEKMTDADWDKTTSAVINLKDREIYVYDNPVVTLTHIQRLARKWAYQYKIKILYVDYIQRIRGNPKLQKHEQVNEIVSGLKNIARELNIPVVALSQVSRGVDSRNDKRPNMGDMADSSAIEKEADVVMTMYRDEVYDENTKDKGVLEISIEKNRHGPTGMIKTAWLGEYMQVKNLARERDGYDPF